MRDKGSVEDRVRRSVKRRKRDVYVRSDFQGGYDQIGRALRALVRTGDLVRIGWGIYARAVPSPIDGRPIPVKGLRGLGVEALARLGVKTTFTKSEREYSEGWTTQVPAGRVIAVTKRVRRKIGFNGVSLSFELACRDE